MAPAEALPAALPLPPAPPEPAVLLPDAFTPVAAEPAPALLGDRADADVAAARQDLQAAHKDLRVARRDVRQADTRAQRVDARQDLRAARQDVSAAKNHLTAAKTDALLADAFEQPAKPSLFAEPAPPRAALADLMDDPAGMTAPIGMDDLTGMAALEQPGLNANGLALGRELPAISQLQPNGAAFGYHNAEMNCAPAAMAMVARGLPGGMLDGKPVDQMSDAELINRLGRHGQTDGQGTSPNGVIAMAQEMGLNTDARTGGLDQNFYDSVLARGGTVIANGAQLIHGQMAGHFVTVTGKTNDGNYLVNNPWSGKAEVYTPAQLDAFLRSNQVNGGVSISVG